MVWRFHQRILLPFLGNPLAYVEVTDKHVRWRHGFNERFELPIAIVRARLETGPTGFFWTQLLGTGDVVITDETTEYRVPMVLRGRALRKRITVQRSEHEAVLEGSSPRHAAIVEKSVIPTQVSFSDRVLVVPCIAQAFSRPLWATNPARDFQTWNTTQYDWVSGGDTLVTLKVGVGLDHWFRRKYTFVALRSPVSGLVLNHTWLLPQMFHFEPFIDHGFDHALRNIFVLLPAGEDVPDDAESVFTEFCRFCDTHLELLSSSAALGNVAGEKMADLIQSQREASIKVISATKDMPKTLENLKAHRPDLDGRLP